jgi:16S rRNA (adenine1518-N6/adenine1519-N6)-dimethyltransferase
VTLSEIQQTLLQHNLKPLKQLGQNFLTDSNISRWIINQLPPDTQKVLEIGPGLGALTRLMLENNWHVTALEYDRGLSKCLREFFSSNPNFTLIEGDALKTLSTVNPHQHWIGNLPYHISTPLLIELLKQPTLPDHAIFMLQKEVGLRFTAVPRTKDYGAVTILLQRYYQIDLLKTIHANVFFPQPQVESVVVKLSRKTEITDSADQRMNFYNWVRKGFSQRRKKLKSLLPVNLDQRAEELSPEQWWDLWSQQSKTQL